MYFLFFFKSSDIIQLIRTRRGCKAQQFLLTKYKNVKDLNILIFVKKK